LARLKSEARCSAGFQPGFGQLWVKTRIRPFWAYVSFGRVRTLRHDGTVIYLADVSYRGDYIHLEMDLKP
jgi:hypothetical protein